MKREPARAFAGASLTRLACALCFLAGAALLVFPIGSRSQPTAETAAAAGGLSPVSLQGSGRPDLIPQVAGTPRTGYRNIEDLRVGQRVHAHNPEIGDDERDAWEEPDWSEWRQLQLEMAQPAGGTLQITMLRPVEWLELVEASPGSEIELDLAEMGACGTARVVSVSAGPDVPPGPGQVVTATFAHPPSTQVLNVTIGSDLTAGSAAASSGSSHAEAETIGVTDNHLFWSVDHEEFLPIGEMAVGERLLTYHGETKRILAKLPRPGPQVVYNLEVYGEHVYFVGEHALLAHNSYDLPSIPGTGRWQNKTRLDGQPYLKPGPKTDINAPHNAKIREIIEEQTSKGLEHIGGGRSAGVGNLAEIELLTKDGMKASRRMVLSFHDPKTGMTIHFNVGLKNVRGDPVIREREALLDVMRHPEFKSKFIVKFREYTP